MLLAGQSGVRLPAKCKNYFSAKNARIISLPKAKPVLGSTMFSNQYPWEKLDLSLGQSGRGYKAATYLRLQQRTRMRGTIPQLPHMT